MSASQQNWEAPQLVEKHFTGNEKYPIGTDKDHHRTQKHSNINEKQ